MTQKTILKLLAGTSKLVNKSTNLLISSSADFIDQAIIKGKYVSREEHEQLKQLVLKLENELSTLKSQKIIK